MENDNCYNTREMQQLKILCNKWFFQNSQNYPALFSALRGYRNGFVYGIKVRAPHALVTTLLFGRGSLREKLLRIVTQTRQHALNLGQFVFTYKLSLAILEHLQRGKRSWHPLISAFSVAYFVFGKRDDGVSTQINLYLLSRVVYALVRLAREHIRLIPSKNGGDRRRPPFNGFALFAATVWGVGLWLFEMHEWTLQSSLRHSMVELYRRGVDPKDWSSIWDFLFAK